MNNKKAFILSLIGIILGGVSWFVFGFLSIPGLILGILALVEVKAFQQTSGESDKKNLILSILTICISGIALLLMIINIISAYLTLSTLICLM